MNSFLIFTPLCVCRVVPVSVRDEKNFSRRRQPASRPRRPSLDDAIPIRMLDAADIVNEVVPLFAIAVGLQRSASPDGMLSAWEHEEVEGLVRLDQRVRDLQRG